MMKKPKSAGAAAFLVILGCCLLLVLGSAAGAVLGYSEVSVTGYQPGPEGITYTGVVNWFKDTCRAFCTTEMPGQVRLKEANAAVIQIQHALKTHEQVTMEVSGGDWDANVEQLAAENEKLTAAGGGGPVQVVSDPDDEDKDKNEGGDEE